MFDTFDHPDMNVTAGASNVSTVPTQALTLLNNPFVLAQAEAARRSRAQRGAAIRRRRSISPTASRWRGRRPRPKRAIALDLITKQSLASFTHVLLNLDEFVYMR